MGPNAVLGLAREGYPKLSFDCRDTAELARFRGISRWRGATSAPARARCATRCGRPATCASARSTPGLTADDLVPREAGIRAQAVLRDGSFVHDFLLRRTARTLHVVNAPSPAATSALPIGRVLARMVLTGEDHVED